MILHYLPPILELPREGREGDALRCVTVYALIESKEVLIRLLMACFY
jgi:hypothetical protein